MKYFFAFVFWFSFSNYGFNQEYPLFITEQGHIIVEVTLCDTVKANFILDTGAGANVLSQKTFDKIKPFATESGHFTGFRHDGDRLDGVTYQIPSLAIGEKVQRDLQVGIYPPLDSYGIDGLVSMKFFEDKPFTIDFKHQKLRFPDADELEGAAFGSNILPLSFAVHTDIALDIFIPLCLEDEVEVTAMFDTGSGYGGFILNPYYLSILEKDSADIQIQPYRTPISQKELKDRIASIRSVGICEPLLPDELKISEVKAVFREGMIYEALVGSALFRDRVITIDIPGKRMIVE